MADHPSWCDQKACNVGFPGGRHCGLAVQARGDDRRPLASAWLEQVPGGPEVIGFAAGTAAVEWTLDEAARVSAAVDEVVKAAGRVRV